MVRIYYAQHVFEAHIIQHLLSLKGIDAEVHNDDANGPGLGPDMHASVWLIDDDDADFARRLIEEHEQTVQTTDREDWVFCRHCQEQNPATFETCWSCSKDM